VSPEHVEKLLISYLFGIIKDLNGLIFCLHPRLICGNLAQFFLVGQRNHSIKGRKKWETTTQEVDLANNLKTLIL
jgi:hypothetical protein